jgi:hypothetical protein
MASGITAAGDRAAAARILEEYAGTTTTFDELVRRAASPRTELSP